MVLNYLEQLEKSIIFIENNLHEDIKVEEIAGAAGYSYYHFHRIFQGVVGEAVGNYLRRRRLTRAAYDLVYTDKRIIDIAIFYQFDSQEAFTRAFKSAYGASPGTYRQNRIQQFLGEKKELTGMKLRHIREGITNQPVIKVVPERKIIGLRGTTTLSETKIPMLWQIFLPRIEEVRNRKETMQGFGVCEVDPGFDMSKFNEETEYTELVGVEVCDYSFIPQGMSCRRIPEGKYAVFTHRGKAEKLQITYDYIWGTWVPCSGFEVDLRDDFELYDGRFLGPDNDESEIDIYLPVK